MSTTYVSVGTVSGHYSVVWKTIFWSGESQGMSGNFMLKILNEHCSRHFTVFVWRGYGENEVE